MIYELRVYHCTPGSLAAVLKRFETDTLALFEKHGIRPAGFFNTMIGASHNDLTYLLAWESLAEREQKWAAFMSDPDWQRAFRETEANGALVAAIENQILRPTAFSALK